MKSRWLILGSAVLATLALTILLGQGAGLAQMPQADLVVVKSVDPGVIAPDDTVLYTVTLTNSTGQAVTVDSITDTLAGGFEFVGMAPGGNWGEEPICVLPVCEWAGPIPIPALGSRVLTYHVYVPGNVPLSPEPYLNTVTALVGADEYTSQAGLLVAKGEASLTKAALPHQVGPGGTVTYTLSFGNNGYVPLSLDLVTDVLPDGVTFLGMTPGSDVQAPPDGVAGTIHWTGPLSIPSQAELLVEYATAMPVVTETLSLENLASGQLEDGTLVGPASTEVVVSVVQPGTLWLPQVLSNYAPAFFTAAKSADPEVVYAGEPGALVAYTVVFSNLGTVAGELVEIHDTLPAGFTFQRMLPGSDVLSNPVGTTGEIVWTGTWPVAGKDTLTVLYEVRASSQSGTYVNSATAIASVGQSPAAPASATVKVQPAILFEDSFDSNADQWTPFTNLMRLSPMQWWWQDWGGHNGGGGTYAFSMYADPAREAHDALSMALVPGSENWTDYRYEAWVWTSPDHLVVTLPGLWFRGTYQESDEYGQWLLGYWFVVYPMGNQVKIQQSQTPDECDPADCEDPGALYHLTNPLTLLEVDYPLGQDMWFGVWHQLAVEVRGNNIKGFVDGNLAIEYTDTVGTIITNGTVGLPVYKAPSIRYDDVLVTPLD